MKFPLGGATGRQLRPQIPLGKRDLPFVTCQRRGLNHAENVAVKVAGFPIPRIPYHPVAGEGGEALGERQMTASHDDSHHPGCFRAAGLING
ncbi:MAG: hypothetical protein GXY83_01080 [Rhodopirellula sp.]|nr:hypothetical protein [Rhodopirellula sp.]